jgi:hypothetical protein
MAGKGPKMSRVPSTGKPDSASESNGFYTSFRGSSLDGELGFADLCGHRADRDESSVTAMDNWTRQAFRIWLSAMCVTAAIALPAKASPWAEVGDAGLRSDIELLAGAGVIDNITTHWPLPWAGILDDLRRTGALANQPYEIREAARRVLAAGEEQAGGGTHFGANLDITSRTAVIRGFDALGHSDAGAQIVGEVMSEGTAARLALGGLKNWNGSNAAIMPDGSYVAQRVGNALLYGGYTSHWWGPGWISALSLSNNARPFPHIGIARIDTSPFQTPWLSWLGPWQAEFFVGLLDDSRVATNTIYDGLRFTFNPLPGLEIGLARTQETCGKGHPCNPIIDYFSFNNDDTDVNDTNDEGEFDIKYSGRLAGTPFEIYMQAMNEDSSPITHSGTSHLFGGSIWVPMQDSNLRLTLEYTDSIATEDIFSFGTLMHGTAYNNTGYIDGMRYRGRTLGFSLDSDSTLLSLQASLRDAHSRTFTFTLHHAAVSNPLNTLGNVVTTTPVKINTGEFRVTWPFTHAKLDLAARLSDDKPRPGSGKDFGIEAAVSFGL